MNGRFVLGVLLAVVLIVGAVGMGVYAYNVGVTQGMVASGKVIAPTTDVAPVPYYRPSFYRPFGFGFGFLGCLFPLFFLFLLFGVLRAFMWRGRWGWRHHRHWESGEHGIPPMVEEWHRKMHEQQAAEK
jgi:hypothetical protein